jgi:hypothetical protein
MSQVESAARQFLTAIDDRDRDRIGELIADDFRFLRPVREGDREVDRQYFAGKRTFLDFLSARFTVRPSDHQVEVWAENGQHGFIEGKIIYVEESVEVGFLSSVRINDEELLDYMNTTLYPLVPAGAPSTRLG